MEETLASLQTLVNLKYRTLFRRILILIFRILRHIIQKYIISLSRTMLGSGLVHPIFQVELGLDHFSSRIKVCR